MKTQVAKIQEYQNLIAPRMASEASNRGTAQLVDNRTSTIAQRKLQDTMNTSIGNSTNPIQRKNNTGLPDILKSGIENLSGYSMDDVKVHYNSSKPAQLQAHAYAQGTDIHLAPGQEKHLPHEAWHVVQQKQGRVKPTRQLKSKVNINDDAGLEKEADVMGARAGNSIPQLQNQLTKTGTFSTGEIIQREAKIVDDRLNIVGESHFEMLAHKNKDGWTQGKAASRRLNEKEFALKIAKGGYFLENEFMVFDGQIEMAADPKFFLFWSDIARIKERMIQREMKNEYDLRFTLKNMIDTKDRINILVGDPREINESDYEWSGINDPNENADKEEQKSLVSHARKLVADLKELMEKQKNNKIEKSDLEEFKRIQLAFLDLDQIKILKFNELSSLRSDYMHKAGQWEHQRKGIWKIGNNHVKHIKTKHEKKANYNILTKEEFEGIFEKWKLEKEAKYNRLTGKKFVGVFEKRKLEKEEKANRDFDLFYDVKPEKKETETETESDDGSLIV